MRVQIFSSIIQTRRKPIGWAIQNAAPLTFYQKASDAALSAGFSNFDKCRPEVADDVKSGVALDYLSADVRANFGDSST